MDAARTQRFGGTRPSGATSRSQLAGGTPTAAKPTPAAQGQKYKSSSDGKMYKNYNDALAAKNSRTGALGVQQGLQKTFKAGGGNAAVAQGKNPLAVMKQGSTNLQAQQRPATPAPGGSAPRPATPAPTAARPATPAPARPTAAKPPAPAPAAAPARNGFGAPTAPMAAQSSVSSATAPAKPSLASGITDIQRMQAASRQRQGLTQSFDIFDVIKGHLIDEGYADTEEAALQIMANMSEEWRESIVENRGMSHSGGKPGASGDGSKPKGITGGKDIQMPGWNDGDDKGDKKKVKGV